VAIPKYPPASYLTRAGLGVDARGGEVKCMRRIDLLDLVLYSAGRADLGANEEP